MIYKRHYLFRSYGSGVKPLKLWDDECTFSRRYASHSSCEFCLKSRTENGVGFHEKDELSVNRLDDSVPHMIDRIFRCFCFLAQNKGDV